LCLGDIWTDGQKEGRGDLYIPPLLPNKINFAGVYIDNSQ